MIERSDYQIPVFVWRSEGTELFVSFGDKDVVLQPHEARELVTVLQSFLSSLEDVG